MTQASWQGNPQPLVGSQFLLNPPCLPLLEHCQRFHLFQKAHRPFISIHNKCSLKVFHTWASNGGQWSKLKPWYEHILKCPNRHIIPDGAKAHQRRVMDEDNPMSKHFIEQSTYHFLLFVKLKHFLFIQHTSKLSCKLSNSILKLEGFRSKQLCPIHGFLEINGTCRWQTWCYTFARFHKWSGSQV